MTIQCPNCGGAIDDSGVASAYRDGHESDRPVWIRDDAIKCPHCDVGLGRSVSNATDHQLDWSFHRSSNLEIICDLTETDVETVKSKLTRYPSMARDLDVLLSRRRATDRTVRHKAAGKTGLAVIRHDAVLGVFLTQTDL